MVLQHERPHLLAHGQFRCVIVIQQPAEDIRRGMDVEIDRPLNGAHQGRGWREDAFQRPGVRLSGRQGRPSRQDLHPLSTREAHAGTGLKAGMCVMSHGVPSSLSDDTIRFGIAAPPWRSGRTSRGL